MTTNTTDELDFGATTGKRATHEALEVTPQTGHILVRNESHADAADHEYTVAVDADGTPVSCTCPAFEYHCGPGEACKHMARAGMAEAVCEAAAPQPATDGGVSAASPPADSSIDATDDDDGARLTEIVAQTLPLEGDLPDFDQFSVVIDASTTTIKHTMEEL